MIWGPFVLALVLGAIVATAVYTAYRWPEAELLADPAEHLDQVAAALPATDTSANTDAEA